VWGHYAEHTPLGPRICRTENVSACHPGVAALVDGPLRDVAADAIARKARTGRIGDGKIFVSSLEDVVRIRTNEHGDAAIYDARRIAVVL